MIQKSKNINISVIYLNLIIHFGKKTGNFSTIDLGIIHRYFNLGIR